MDRILIIRQLSYPREQRQVTAVADRNIFLMAGVVVERRQVSKPCSQAFSVGYQLDCELVSTEFVVIDQFQVYCPCTDPTEQHLILQQIQSPIVLATQGPEDTEPDPTNNLFEFVRRNPTAIGLLILHDQDRVPAQVLKEIQERKLDWQPLESLIQVVVPVLTKHTSSFEECVWMERELVDLERKPVDPNSPLALE